MTYSSIMLFFLVLDRLPCEYVLDFGPSPVAFEYKMIITPIARDGSALSLPVGVGQEVDPAGPRDHVLHALTDNDWVARPGPGATLIVTGTTKGSAVRLVTVKSEAKVPTVRWVPIAPKPPKPKK